MTTALRESRQEWRRHSPVERAANKPLQERFESLTATLQTRLDAEYARNVKEKERLIERARQLLGSEDSRASIEAVKELQQQWRAIGPVPRETEHRLWEEFRQHCDAIFQRRQQEYTQYTAGLESNKAQALEICEKLEKLAASSGNELLQAAQAGLPELRQAFEATGEFPRNEARELRARFERALELCEAGVAREQARAAERRWEAFFEAADRVRAYRLALVQGSQAPQLEAAKQQTESCIASVERWPKGGLEAIKQALATPPCADLSANARALKLLCIRAEILTDTATPAEDLPLRREYQVQRLMRSMGQGLQPDETELDAIAIEWVGCGPVEDGLHAPLLERLRRCRQHRGAQRA